MEVVSRSVEFFACASRCALQPLHKVGREDGGRLRPQCAGRVSNLKPTIGLPPWYQERPGSAKTHGMVCTWAADTPPYLFFFLFFCLLPYPLPFSSTPVFSSCFSSSSISFSPCFSFVLSLFFVADAAERLVPLWCTYVPRCCGDVFSLPVLLLKLSRWHRATCFTTIFLLYFIFFC